jgi:RimJ/RimL family protein N-acetyltransferase
MRRTIDLSEVSLAGRNIYLKEISLEDSETILKWRNDRTLGRFMTRETLTLAQQHAFYHDYMNRENDYYFVACLKGSLTRVGTIAIYDIDSDRKVGEIGRLVIDPLNRLFTVEICSLFFLFCFEILDLDRVVAHAQRLNKSSWSFLLGLGFTIEDTLKNAWWNRDDVLRLAIRRQDYLSQKTRWQALIPEPRYA